MVFSFGGLFGIIMLALFSMSLGNRDYWNIVSNYSKSSLIVFAWQIIYLFAIEQVGKKTIGTTVHDDIWILVLSVCIYAVFVPVIRFVNKYLSILIGYRK